jgi:hypothetical protein
MGNSVGHLSASSIAAFKSCPQRYRLGYVEALREAVEPQPLRFGTAWHKGKEILKSPGGTLDAAVLAATEVYTTIPDWADATDWAVEREVVANALAAYHWLYSEDQTYETVATEVQFELPLRNPETGRPTPNMVRVGKIDEILRNKVSGILLIGENKTTSKPIDSASSYWQRLRLDTQSMFYILAAREVHGQPISGLVHEVFHKPQISPKMLTQAESKAFVETGEYCDQKFTVEICWPDNANPGVGAAICTVDEACANVEPGKKEGTFAVRETPGMYGARLLQDMTTRPEYYFARKEVAFTDDQLQEFEEQLWSLQKNMNEMERTGRWFKNEFSCESTFKCPYCVLCYNQTDVFHGQTPAGFKRLRIEEAEQSETGGAE